MGIGQRRFFPKREASVRRLVRLGGVGREIPVSAKRALDAMEIATYLSARSQRGM